MTCRGEPLVSVLYLIYRGEPLVSVFYLIYRVPPLVSGKGPPLWRILKIYIINEFNLLDDKLASLPVAFLGGQMVNGKVV
jgi:hypothetical protein